MRVTKVKPGDVSGPFRIVSRLESQHTGTPTWKVVCRHCNTESVISGSGFLVARKAMGCKSCVRERERQLLNYKAGMKVGDLTLTKPATQHGIRSSWYARCSCGAVDTYKIRDLWWVKEGKLKGCSVCREVEAKEPVYPTLHFSYKDETGLAIQKLYLNGLVPT